MKDNPCTKCGCIKRNKNGRCSGCNKAACKLAYEKNKEKYHAASKVWVKNNPERRKEIVKKSLDAVPGRGAKYSKDWQERNKEKHAQAKAEWRKKNKPLLRVLCINRRRRIADSGSLSKNVAEIKGKFQRGRCACCGVKLNGAHHIDHIIPIALGGTNTDDNIQLLCPSCNLRKSAKHPVDYMQSLGYLL